MSKKKKESKPEVKKEEKKPEPKKPPYWFYPVCCFVGLLFLNSLIHGNGPAVVGAPSTSGPALVPIQAVMWSEPNQFGQRELLPVIYENGQQILIRRDRLKGSLTQQDVQLIAPTAPDWKYSVLPRR